MKTSVLLFGLALLTAEASSVGPLCLPRSPFADTESVTNVSFACRQQGLRSFGFALTFVGTVSNNVQLAFGRDADFDGELSVPETDLTFAWDCGEWLLVGPEGISAQVQAAATTNAVRELDWNLRLKRNRPKSLSVCENGVPLFQDLEENPCEWLFNPSWDILRLTVRGADAAEENVSVRLDVSGYVIHVR